MNAEKVLTDGQIVEIARSLRWQTQYSEINDNAVELARAIEHAVLQSSEIKQLREAAEELAGWAKHEVGAEPELTSGLQAIRALIK